MNTSVYEKCTAGSAIPEADSTPRIVEALRKAGVNPVADTSKRKLPSPEPDKRKEGDEDQEQGKGKYPNSITQNGDPVPEPVLVKHFDENESTSSTTGPGQTDNEKRSANHLSRKKSGSFAEGTKTEDSEISRKRQPNPLFAKARSPPAIATAETVLDVQNKTPSDQLTALLNAEVNILRCSNSTVDLDARITSPVIPEHESQEDAALRRQMLQYNMQEVGAVVAEIDLDDDASTPPYSEDEDEDDTSVEEEDEHGRSTNIVLSDEYIKEMKALEKRLDASMIKNVGPIMTSESLSLSQTEKSNGVVANPDSNATLTSKDSSTKCVHFAEDLDIQQAPIHAMKKPSSLFSVAFNPTSDNSKPLKSRTSRSRSARSRETRSKHEDEQPQLPTRTVASAIAERAVPNTSVSPQPNLSIGTTSETWTRDDLIETPDHPHADTIIERPFSPDPINPPPEPDEFDSKLLQQQVVTEYHRQRNRMIHRQGGFLPREEDEQAEVPVDEYGNEKGRKVSRFMATRLGRRGG